jgi:ribosomal protein S10
MFINIVIKTKNKNSLLFFVKFFYNLLKLEINKNILLIKQTNKKIKIKKFNVLKSPHVNKKSIESFEYCIYNIQILLYTFEYKKLIKLLKKIKSNLFLDIKFKIHFLINSNFLIKKKILNSDNFLIQNKITSKYLKLLDIYGEICLT